MSEEAGDFAVDVVVNNYNYGRFLGAAIESALDQTWPGVSVIVVDDGSSDGSRELLRGYEDKVEVVLKENGGQASALNAGVAHCRGDAIVFLDADDVLHPEAAARVAAAFADDPDLAKVQYRMETVDEAGRPTGAIKPEPHLPMPNGDLREAELASPYDLVWLATSGNAFRAEAVRRVLPIPEDAYRICADWYLVHMTTLLGPVRSLEEICASYRLHGGNSYEPQAAALDLEHLRTNVRLAQTTSRALLGLANELDLEPPRRILSIADLANRMISRRLEPAKHPIAADSPLRLVGDAVGAVRRRQGVAVTMKAMFVAWFAAMAVAPRPLARRLARLFLFPGSRPGLNRFLGRLQKDR